VVPAVQGGEPRPGRGLGALSRHGRRPPGDSTDAARDYTARLGNTWPSAVDATGQVALSYGVFGPPETYFIGKDGIIAGRHIGPIDVPTLVNGIEALRRAAKP